MPYCRLPQDQLDDRLQRFARLLLPGCVKLCVVTTWVHEQLRGQIREHCPGISHEFNALSQIDLKTPVVSNRLQSAPLLT